MPFAAAASNNDFELASVPQVRTVLTPIAFSSGSRCAASVGGGPQVRPFTTQGALLTSSCQLPWLPAIRTVPVPGAGSLPPGVPKTLNSKRETPYPLARVVASIRT